MKNSNDIPDDDQQLFRDAIEGTRPLAEQRMAPYRQQPPARPVAQPQEVEVITDQLSDEWRPEEIETDEELSFSRGGLQHALLKKLRRGQFAIDAELDLHGMRVVEARQVMAQFITTTPGRVVRIIHGKGHGSLQQQPIIKSKLNLWLRQWERVLAFHSARPCDGGTGAVYVLLKRLR